MPGGRGAEAGARRSPQEGHQEETREPGLAGGEPEETDLTHGRPAARWEQPTISFIIIIIIIIIQTACALTTLLMFNQGAVNYMPRILTECMVSPHFFFFF